MARAARWSSCGSRSLGRPRGRSDWTTLRGTCGTRRGRAVGGWQRAEPCVLPGASYSRRA
eukprot:5289737-Pyramimonas_sp.AAC.1